MAEHIRFGVKNIRALPFPAKGERSIYRDSVTPHLCLRVTPTAKTFYWEKTIAGKQQRVTIGRFPDINPEHRLFVLCSANDAAAVSHVGRRLASNEPPGCGCTVRPRNAALPTSADFRKPHHFLHAGFGCEPAAARSLACDGSQGGHANRSSRLPRPADNGTSNGQEKLRGNARSCGTSLRLSSEERRRLFQKISFLLHPGQVPLQQCQLFIAWLALARKRGPSVGRIISTPPTQQIRIDAQLATDLALRHPSVSCQSHRFALVLV